MTEVSKHRIIHIYLLNCLLAFLLDFYSLKMKMICKLRGRTELTTRKTRIGLSTQRNSSTMLTV